MKLFRLSAFLKWSWEVGIATMDAVPAIVLPHDSEAQE